ncbi:MAG: flagellar export chaperone FlgN [Planctomycetota bacterium]
MTDTRQRDGRRLTELLTRQRDAYRRLADLAARQRDAIDGDEPEVLLRILADRQKCINEVTELNGQLEPFRQRWDELRGALGPAERLTVSELVDEVQDLLAGILNQDAGDCDLLKQRTDAARGAATATATGQRLNSVYGAAGYGAAAGGAGTYVDRTDEERTRP